MNHVVQCGNLAIPVCNEGEVQGATLGFLDIAGPALPAHPFVRAGWQQKYSSERADDKRLMRI